MQDTTERFIENPDGSIQRVEPFPIGRAATPPPAPLVAKKQYFRYLKDNISNKFYPISSRSAIQGGIGRGSSRDLISFDTYINANFTGVVKRYTMGDHFKYYVVDLTRKTGTFQVGDNILLNPVPVTYMPPKDLIFRASLVGDTTSAITLFLGATDGRLHCFIKPKYELNVTTNNVTQVPLLTATHITGVASYIE